MTNFIGLPQHFDWLLKLKGKNKNNCYILQVFFATRVLESCDVHFGWLRGVWEHLNIWVTVPWSRDFLIFFLGLSLIFRSEDFYDFFLGGGIRGFSVCLGFCSFCFSWFVWEVTWSPPPQLEKPPRQFLTFKSQTFSD